MLAFLPFWHMHVLEGIHNNISTVILGSVLVTVLHFSRMRIMSARWPPILKQICRPTWVVGPPVGWYRQRPPCFIVITQPESRYSFCCSTNGRKLSLKGAHPFQWLYIIVDVMIIKTSSGEIRIWNLSGCTNTQGEVTSQSLWSRYDRHIVGITRSNLLS